MKCCRTAVCKELNRVLIMRWQCFKYLWAGEWLESPFSEGGGDERGEGGWLSACMSLPLDSFQMLDNRPSGPKSNRNASINSRDFSSHFVRISTRFSPMFVITCLLEVHNYVNTHNSEGHIRKLLFWFILAILTLRKCWSKYNVTFLPLSLSSSILFCRRNFFSLRNPTLSSLAE